MGPGSCSSTLNGKSEVRGELASNAADSHRVGTVGRDGEVEHDVVESEHLAHVGAERRVGGQRDDAVVVVAEPELARRAQHSLGDDTANLAAFDLEVAGQHRADLRERHDHSRFDVGRAAHDAQLTGAELDVGQANAIGIGVRNDIEDASNDDTVDVASGLVDGLDFQAELVERVGDVAGRGRDRRELADPREGRAHQNCLANLTSPSHRFFTWSTP